MIELDEEALICDLAETYHIYDYKKLPLKMVAIFCAGLRSNSRIIRKMAGYKEESIEIMLLSAIVDRLSMLWWAKTEDGHKNQNRPKLLLSDDSKAENINTFRSCGDFENERNKLLNKIKRKEVD